MEVNEKNINNFKQNKIKYSEIKKNATLGEHLENDNSKPKKSKDKN